MTRFLPSRRPSRRDFAAGTVLSTAALTLGEVRALTPERPESLLQAGAAQTVVTPTAVHVNAVSPFAPNMVFGYTNGLECYVGTCKDY